MVSLAVFPYHLLAYSLVFRYEEEHLDKLSKLPGWLRTTRYELIDSLKTGMGKDPATNAAPRFLTLYGMSTSYFDGYKFFISEALAAEFTEEGKDVLSSDQLKEANETPRAKEILAACDITERMWKLCRAWPNTAHKS